jgi:mono/diheme cytochrome c family protein
MRRWYPFLILIIAIFMLVNFLIFTGQDDEYIPETSDPSVVYQQACVRCHGERGEGDGMFYPDLSDEVLFEDEVFRVIRNGDFLMPAFPNIPDSTLHNLVEYVVKKRL